MDPKTVEDLQMLQGKWRQVRFEENGLIDPVDTHSAPGAVLTISGNNFHVGLAGEDVILEGCFSLDACPFPKAITWIDAIGEDAGKSLPAIYDLSDENFIFVAADEGMPRPTAFASIEGLTLRAFVRV